MRDEGTSATLVPVPLRCLIVDDSSALLAAASALLEREGIDVVGVASTVAEGARLASELRPDVTLVDIDLGGESGFDLVRQIAADGDGPRLDVILISTHAERDFADLIQASPALGFLPKSDLSAKAIRELLSGPRET
jgi:DNA-binding NarL/FixJ family response regulator